jgi:flagellar basal-body rod modification protein FlgD
MIPPILAATAASAALGAISSLASAAQSSPASSASDAGATTGATVASKRNDQLDRTDFLTLLVAQLQAQDPLNPMDGADFSAQLAQFSSLEQLMSIDGRLAKLGEGAGAPATDPVSFLGREVAVAGGALSIVDGESLPIGFTLEEAGSVTLSLVDGSGKEVASVDLGAREAGRQSVDLDELAGAPDLADGEYGVKLTQRTATGETRELTALVFGRVTGVDLSADPPVLVVGDRRVALTDVREVREPAAMEKAES